MRSRCGDLACGGVRGARRQRRGRTPPTAICARTTSSPTPRPEEWLDCGQCRGCFKPSFAYRPTGVRPVRHGARGARRARSRPTAVHSASATASWPPATATAARPGHGLQAGRVQHDDRRTWAHAGVHLREVRRNSNQRHGGSATQPQPPKFGERIGVKRLGRARGELPVPGRAGRRARPGPQPRGHLGGARAPPRSTAPADREFCLWFDLKNAARRARTHGRRGHAWMRDPALRGTRAVGSFVNSSPAARTRWGRRGLRPERLQRLCRDECYHPGDRRRHPIAADRGDPHPAAGARGTRPIDPR